ncbi:MAG: carbohydrate ABC transporter permease [Phycisphaerales bacterium]|jgi:ABC-type glycerol-3-phosphate transport system permease component|nr:carbohydrate ABC transporter permease [Phycisphaerales bacterium]
MNPNARPFSIWTVAAYALLLPLAVLTLIPFVWLACAALKAPEDFFSSMFLPTGEGFLGIAWSKLTLVNFRTVLFDAGMARAMVNSMLIASLTSILATLASAMAGYTLACHKFRGKRAVEIIVLGGLLVPAPLIIAPGYQWLYTLGLLDTWTGLILPAIAPAFGILLFRQASLRSIPPEVLEAARIDGAGEGAMFFTVALPMLRPMIGAFMMITFLATWNNFITPQIVLQSDDKFPLSVLIAQLADVYRQDYGVIMAGTLFSIFPVMILFLALQREFISGLTMGAVKG